MAQADSPVHPELRGTAPILFHLHFQPSSLKTIRWLYRLKLNGRIPPGVQVSRVDIPGPGASIRLRVYQPQTGPALAPALLWIHGGGYVVGRPEIDDPGMFHFVQELGIRVISVDYRLAPEYPFPAPLDDCYAALQWVHDNAPSLGIDPARIAVGGESAGGGLAAALAQLARDRVGPPIAFQLLVYPMLDDRTCLLPDPPNAQWFTWSTRSNRFGWGSYLDQPYGADDVPPYAVPARRANLSDLPPAWIGVGTLDLFYSEDRFYADRLKNSGIDCEFVELPGVYHGFEFLQPRARLTRHFRDLQTAALRRHLCQSPQAQSRPAARQGQEMNPER